MRIGKINILCRKAGDFFKVKARDGATLSLNHLIDKDKYADIRYGIKLGNRNIGYNGKFYTFPYFLAIFLKRFVKDVTR